MKAVNVLLAVLVSLLIGVAVFEGGLRLFPQFRPMKALNRFDPKLGWVKKPNVTVRRQTPEVDVTFEINALGLRDDPMSSPDKAPNTYRVLMLGDSFVLGYTVDRDNLFVDHLERVWKEEKRRFDVVNAGTEGYSTDQEVLWYLEHGVDYDADLVLLFPYENDVYWNGQTDYRGQPKPRFRPDGTLETGTLAEPPPKPSILPGTAIGRFLETSVLPFLASLKKEPGPGPYDFEPEGGDGIWFSREFAPLMKQEPDFLADCWARTGGALKALEAKCAETRTSLLVVPIPSEMSTHAEEREAFRTWDLGLKGLPDELWSPDRPVNRFLALAKELGIDTLDARSAFRAYIEAQPQKRLYYPGAEWHFNELGNEVFANYLHNELDNLDVFPADHGAIARAEILVPESSRRIPVWLQVFVALWVFLGTSYQLTYKDEKFPLGFLKVGGLLALVFTIVIGGNWALGRVPAAYSTWILLGFVAVVLGFVAYKLGRRVGTILELLRSFTLRGHWYLMPLVVVLLTIGSLLVVAASSPLIAPFIYTLF